MTNVQCCVGDTETLRGQAASRLPAGVLGLLAGAAAVVLAHSHDFAWAVAV